MGIFDIQSMHDDRISGRNRISIRFFAGQSRWRFAARAGG